MAHPEHTFVNVNDTTSAVNLPMQLTATAPSAPVPGQPHQPSIYDEQVPPKNPEKYSAAITERVRHQKMLTGEFFKENVERAKTRNERYEDHE